MRRQSIFLIAFAVFVLDRLTKALILGFIPSGSSFELGPLSIVHVTNTGVTWGLLKEYSLIPVLASIVVIGLIVKFHKKIPDSYSLIAGLVLGGAVGNLLDRALYGAVIDFIDFHWWPVFNIADSAITIAAVLIIYDGLTEKKGNNKGKRSVEGKKTIKKRR